MKFSSPIILCLGLANAAFAAPPVRILNTYLLPPIPFIELEDNLLSRLGLV
jgi:hypothetical protein